MIYRAFRYKLAPTTEQAAKLAQFVGVTRLVYNLALEQRVGFWRQYRAATGGSLNFVSQGRQVTDLRREFDWIREVPSVALTQALRDLDQAFTRFWRGTADFPTFRKRAITDSFRLKGADLAHRKLNGKWGSVCIPKLGWVKYRMPREHRGKILNATVVQSADGWFIAMACEVEHEVTASEMPAVGIDRGVANTIALSTGELLSTPSTGKLENRRKRAQRVLARRARGSNRYKQQRQKVGRIVGKIARVRADWRHKTTLGIAQRCGLAVVEDLRTANMTRSGKHKRGLNRSIREQGWRAFATALAYKVEERGGSLEKVNPAYTSQTCSGCGTIDKASRESQASFACRHCGFAAHADTNAAINILRRSTASMRAEGAGYGPNETRTVNHALAA